MSVAPEDAAWLVVVKPSGQGWQSYWFAHDEEVYELEESLLEEWGYEGFSAVYLPDLLEPDPDGDGDDYALLLAGVARAFRAVEDVHLPAVAAGGVDGGGGDPPVAP